MSLSLDFDPIAARIDPLALILTPNARTKQALEVGRFTRLPVGEVVNGLNLYSWGQWLDHLWYQLSFTKPLPTLIPNLIVKTWFQTQIEKESQWVLTNPKGVAEQVLDAYRNLCHYRLRISELNPTDRQEVHFLIQWVSLFERFCLQQNILPEFKKLSFLLEHSESLATYFPPKILLVGFNHFTPIEKEILELVEQQGTCVEYYSCSIKSSSRKQLMFDNLKSELEFAAQYTYQNVSAETKKYAAESQQTIAVVVNQLSQNLPLVHEVFSRVFQPQEEKPWLPLAKPLYNVSAGAALSEQPIIQAALKLLKINPKRVSYEDLDFLKNTPYIFNANIKVKLGYFLHQQILFGRKRYDLQYLVDKNESKLDPDLLESLSGLVNGLEGLKGKKSIAAHLLSWKRLLAELGLVDLNSDRPLDLFEVEALEMLDSIFDDVLKVDLINPKICLQKALEYLQNACSAQTFQVASDRTNVQILGILEASGLEFEQLILVGFSQDNWPQKNKINPFIPLHFQREKDMPGSSATREYHYTKTLSNSLLSSSKTIIATASRDEVSGQSNISYFFSEFEPATSTDLIEKLNPIEPAENASYNAVTSESEQAEAERWRQGDYLDMSSIDIKGGAYLLSDYAKCPFQAMLKYQFKVEDYQQESIGLDPREKGGWLHASMESIWLQLQSQQQLKAMAQQQLKKLISDSVYNRLQNDYQSAQNRIGKTLAKMEAEKLIERIIQWFCIELDRDEFKVEQLESRVELNLGEFSLNLKVDRVDVNANNELEISDYKTGVCQLQTWFSARPTEAQMPAYFLAFEPRPIASIQYVKIRTGDIGRLGLSIKNSQIQKLDDAAAKIKSTYFDKLNLSNVEDLKQQWQSSLQRLAKGISRGYFPVSPKDPTKHCVYCDYGAICRIKEERVDED